MCLCLRGWGHALTMDFCFLHLAANLVTFEGFPLLLKHSCSSWNFKNVWSCVFLWHIRCVCACLDLNCLRKVLSWKKLLSKVLGMGSDLSRCVRNLQVSCSTGKRLPHFSVVSLLRAVASLKLTGTAVSYGASSSGGCAAAAFVVGLWLKMFGFGRWRSLRERLNKVPGMYCALSIKWFSLTWTWSVFGNDKDTKVSYFSIACVSQHDPAQCRWCSWQQGTCSESCIPCLPQLLPMAGCSCHGLCLLRNASILCNQHSWGAAAAVVGRKGLGKLCSQVRWECPAEQQAILYSLQEL